MLSYNKRCLQIAVFAGALFTACTTMDVTGHPLQRCRCGERLGRGCRSSPAELGDQKDAALLSRMTKAFNQRAALSVAVAFNKLSGR
jgi:hypothetical protein